MSKEHSDGRTVLMRGDVASAAADWTPRGRMPSANQWALPLIVAFSVEIFFATATVIGYSYPGRADSGSYSTYAVIVAALGYASAAATILAKGQVLRLRQTLILSLPLMIGSVYLLDSILFRTEQLSERYFAFFFIFSLPAALAGAMASTRAAIQRFSLVLEPIMLLFTAASVAYAANTIVAGWDVMGLGGATYQKASYMGGAAFSFNLYHLLFGRNHVRWPYTRFSLYRVCSYGFLPVQALAVLLSGGRGGFVLLVVNLVVLVISGVLYMGRRVVTRLVSLTTVILLGSAVGLPWIVRDDARASVVGRVFSYVGARTVKWEGTSNRDQVYADAWHRIDLAPFSGYGLFSWGGGGYPHNLLLEWLLNGGITYFAFWVILLLSLSYRLLHLARRSKELLIMIPLAAYPLVMLMFSGTYWTSGPFWFALSVIFCVETQEGARAVSQVDRRRG